MLKTEIMIKLSECHDEIKNHPFRLGFDGQYIGDYKRLLYQLTEIWCDLIYRNNELPETERQRLVQFGYWIHDYRQHLRTWNHSTFPMHFFDYYEQMLQITHNFIDNGDLSAFYNLDCYFTENKKQIKPTRYIWVTEDMCDIKSDILPRYFPVSSLLVVDEEKMKEYFSKGFYTNEPEEKREAHFQYWLKNTKPVLEWINSQRKSIDLELPVWQSAIVTPSKCK